MGIYCTQSILLTDVLLTHAEEKKNFGSQPNPADLFFNAQTIITQTNPPHIIPIKSITHFPPKLCHADLSHVARLLTNFITIFPEKQVSVTNLSKSQS